MIILFSVLITAPLVIDGMPVSLILVDFSWLRKLEEMARCT